MATNLAINDVLLDTALDLGGFKTKKETVNMALQEFIQRRGVEDVISLFNSIEYAPKYSYKKLRRRE
jgi:hypothetical protein